MLAAAKTRFATWLFQYRGPEAGTIVLSRRRVFILPTRQGLAFAVVLVTMLIGAINYNLSLGFMLTFMLMAVAFNGMLYTFRNLARLRISAGRTQSVFAGEPAIFNLTLANDSKFVRHAIGIARVRLARGEQTYCDVPARGSAELAIRIPTERRGRLNPGRVTLFTRYPLGLYYAWSYVHTQASCIVYPRPASTPVPLPQALYGVGSGTVTGQGSDDFAGLRGYRPGDPSRHIAWKAAARGQGLLTKQFSGQAAREVWLRWELLPLRMAVEEKLSCLTRWVLDAHAGQLLYGLRLPGVEVAPGRGDAHRQRCLEALALFGLDENDAT